MLFALQRVQWALGALLRLIDFGHSCLPKLKGACGLPDEMLLRFCSEGGVVATVSNFVEKCL